MTGEDGGDGYYGRGGGKIWHEKMAGMDIIGGEGRGKDMTGEDGGDGYYGRRGRGG